MHRTTVWKIPVGAINAVTVDIMQYHPWSTSYQTSLAGFDASRRHLGDADFPHALSTGRRDMTETLLKAA